MTGDLFDARPGEARSTSAERTKRILDAAELAAADDPESIYYQHTVFCQTGLPYKNPGREVTTWKQVNGHVHMAVTAGMAMDPRRGELVQMGLPYGPKPRLVMAHLNGEALRRHSPEIEVEASLTAFVKRLHLDPGGRTIGSIKEQLSRLSAAHITLGTLRGGCAMTVNSQIVTAFDLWFPKSDGQRVLWPSTLRLSADYYDSLTRNAVPLHDQALRALSGSPMGLDIYAWLAQRLHRVKPGQPTLMPWPVLHTQFGWGYEKLAHFKVEFNKNLRLVRTQYKAARIEHDADKNLVLHHSPSPVRSRTVIDIRKSDIKDVVPAGATI